MAIDVLNTGTAAGSGDGESLRSAMTKVNSNFGAAENAASKIVQASSADTTADKVMLSDHAWRGAQLGDYFTYGGTANAITLTSANLRAGGTLIKGMKFRFEATATNTGATTIAVDGGSAITCVTPTGVALPAGFIRTDVFTECEYDGSSFVVSRKVESGSNANGEWTRWEDGRQECTKSQSGTSSEFAFITVTFSRVFSIILYVNGIENGSGIGNNNGSGQYLSVRTNAVPISSTDAVLFNLQGGLNNRLNNTDYAFNFKAEGKWY